jgi:hypothetical protein
MGTTINDGGAKVKTSLTDRGGTGALLGFPLNLNPKREMRSAKWPGKQAVWLKTTPIPIEEGQWG